MAHQHTKITLAALGLLLSILGIYAYHRYRQPDQTAPPHSDRQYPGTAPPVQPPVPIDTAARLDTHVPGDTAEQLAPKLSDNTVQAPDTTKLSGDTAEQLASNLPDDTAQAPDAQLSDDAAELQQYRDHLITIQLGHQSALDMAQIARDMMASDHTLDTEDKVVCVTSLGALGNSTLVNVLNGHTHKAGSYGEIVVLPGTDVVAQESDDLERCTRCCTLYPAQHNATYRLLDTPTMGHTLSDAEILLHQFAWQRALTRYKHIQHFVLLLYIPDGSRRQSYLRWARMVATISRVRNIPIDKLLPMCTFVITNDMSEQQIIRALDVGTHDPDSTFAKIRAHICEQQGIITVTQRDILRRRSRSIATIRQRIQDSAVIATDQEHRCYDSTDVVHAARAYVDLARAYLGKIDYETRQQRKQGDAIDQQAYQEHQLLLAMVDFILYCAGDTAGLDKVAQVRGLLAELAVA